VYRNCALCHGPDPATRSLNIQKGVTVAALRAAYGNVGQMNQFQTSLSSTQNLDLAAYIKSRVGP
jgi:mono/diheme cytochrome c family protein